LLAPSAADNAPLLLLMVVLLYLLAVLVDAVDLIDVGLVVVAVAAVDVVMLTVYSLEPVILAALLVPSRSSDPLVPVTSFASATPPSISTPHSRFS
jgi:hypothetical protein